MLYKVKMIFEAVVDAESMAEAIDEAESAVLRNEVDSKGSGTLITRQNQIPALWANQVPINARVKRSCLRLFEDSVEGPE